MQNPNLRNILFYGHLQGATALWDAVLLTELKKL